MYKYFKYSPIFGGKEPAYTDYFRVNTETDEYWVWDEDNFVWLDGTHNSWKRKISKETNREPEAVIEISYCQLPRIGKLEAPEYFEIRFPNGNSIFCRVYTNGNAYECFNTSDYYNPYSWRFGGFDTWSERLEKAKMQNATIDSISPCAIPLNHEEWNKIYAERTKKMPSVEKKVEEFGYLFDSQAVAIVKVKVVAQCNEECVIQRSPDSKFEIRFARDIFTEVNDFVRDDWK